MFASRYSPLAPATIGALVRIITNREGEPKRRERIFFSMCLYVFLSIVELGHVVMVKSASEEKSAGSHNEKPLDCRDWLTPCRPWRRTKKSFSSGRRLSRALLGRHEVIRQFRTTEKRSRRDYTAVLTDGEDRT